MTNILKKLIGKIKKNNKIKQNRARRVRQDTTKIQYVTLTDSSNNKFSGKLIDMSESGCKIVFSNMKLFRDSEYTMVMNETMLKSKVIWSEQFKLDFSRYCIVGVKF